MQSKRSKSKNVAQRRRLALWLSAFAIGGMPTIGFVLAGGGMQEAPAKGIINAVGIRYLNKPSNPTSASPNLQTQEPAAVLPESVPAMTPGVPLPPPPSTSNSQSSVALDAPTLKWDLSTVSPVSSPTLTVAENAENISQKSVPSQASTNRPGSLTVNFEQPKRWVLPPVKVRTESHESQSNDSIPVHDMSVATKPEVVKPNPLSIGPLVPRVEANATSAALTNDHLAANPVEQDSDSGRAIERSYSLPNMVVNTEEPSVETQNQDKIAVPIKWITAGYTSTTKEEIDSSVAEPKDDLASANAMPPRVVGSYLDQLESVPSAVANAPSSNSSPKMEATIVQLPASASTVVPQQPSVARPEPEILRPTPQVVRTQPTVPSSVPITETHQPEIVDSRTSSRDAGVAISEPKLVVAQPTVASTEPMVSRLSPMIIQEPEMPVVLRKRESPPIAAVTAPTWDALSDASEDSTQQDTTKTPEDIVEPLAQTPIADQPMESNQRVEEPSPAFDVAVQRELPTTMELPSTPIQTPLPTAEIALLTLEKLEPVGDSGYSDSAGTAANDSSRHNRSTIYSLSDNQVRRSDDGNTSLVLPGSDGKIPASGVLAGPIPESVLHRPRSQDSMGSTIGVPTPVPAPASVGIARVEMTVGERRSLRLAVPISNSEIADQRVCLLHKANAHELILQPLSTGLTSVTVWFRNPATGADSQVVIMVEVRDVTPEVAEIVVESESIAQRVAMPAPPPVSAMLPSPVIEPVVSSYDRSHQVQPQSLELSEAIRKAFPNVECELRWDNKGELHVHGRSPDDVTAKRLLSFVRQSYLVPVHDKILIEP